MRIGLCTPCYGANVNNQYFLSAIATERMAVRLGHQIKFYTAPGCAVLPRVRNLLVSRALADGCDWVFFIDDDIAWEARDFFKMLEHGVDVVAAAPAKRHKRWNDDPAAVAKFPVGKITGMHTKVGRVWKMDAVASGFMAIRATTFEKMEGVTRACISEGRNTRNWFWLDFDDYDHDEGEDYNFCSKFIEAGGSVWVDPDVRVRHYAGNVCHDFCLADSETKEERVA